MYKLWAYCMMSTGLALGLSGCLCSDQPIEEEVVPEAPEISGILADRSRIETRDVTFIRVNVAAQEDERWHLQWDSDCGMVIGVPGDKTRATFTAPDIPGTCTVRANVFDGRMLDNNERQIAIVVTPTLDREIIR